uniref:Uncharacterized protein n=1 Tax=Nicotiana tabacum TaxID=4097 RepID=A0A1S4CAE6_TOBAC
MDTPMDPIVESLLSSFRQVPPAAIPGMLDCILASTNAAPSSIFSTLLNEFPTFSKGIVDGSKHLDFEQRNCVVSFVSAICHLLKKSGGGTGAIDGGTEAIGGGAGDVEEHGWEI